MKLKVVIVDLEIPPRVKKWGLRIGIPAVVLGVAAVAFAGPQLTTWNQGDTLNADALNANFSYLQNQITGDAGLAGQLAATASSIPVVTGWQRYTRSLVTQDGQAINNALVAGSYRRVGDTLEYKIGVTFPAGPSGSTSSQQWTLSLPSGLQVDTTKLPQNRNSMGSGSAWTGTLLYALAGVGVLGNVLITGLSGESGDLSTAFPSGGFLQNTGFSLEGTVPIVGWR